MRRSRARRASPSPARLLPLLVLATATACAVRTPPARTPAITAPIALAQRVDTLGATAREPMVVEHPDGTLFVAGYHGAENSLWRSTDGGASWSRVDPGASAAGRIGNSDVDLAVARDGTLYWASMTFDRQASEGRRIAVGVSRDRGATWRWSTLSAHRFDDRPWIEVAPDGTAHAIWNDGSGVWHALSRDRGASWTEPSRIHDRGGSSHLAISPAGTIAVRITPASASGNKLDAGVDLIAVSSDGGASWRKVAAPGQRDWPDEAAASAALPRWVEPLAWDRDENLYSLWTDISGVRLARSRDRGASWTAWTIAPSTGKMAFYPFLVSRAAGDLVATWFSASSPDATDLEWHCAHAVLGRGDEAPTVAVTTHTLESVGKGDDGVFRPSTAGEYLSIVALHDGSIGVVTPIQNEPAGRGGFTWWKFTVRP